MNKVIKEAKETLRAASRQAVGGESSIMANILDIRRRIRSVTNTRQITKAMKMVSAAKLRRAQERALAARPYAQMLTNVLKSLVTRAEMYDPETGQPRHPLLAQRPEQNVLLIVVTGDKGLAGAFNTNILKAALRFLQSKADKNVEIEAIRPQGPRLSAPALSRQPSRAPARPAAKAYVPRSSASRSGFSTRSTTIMASELADRKSSSATAKKRSIRCTSVYNEFKSVIAQRLVVEQILPIEQIGARRLRQSEEMTQEERERAAEAARASGHRTSGAGYARRSMRQRPSLPPRRSTTFTSSSPEELFRSLLPKYVAIQIFQGLLESVAAEHAARMTAMDSATNNATRHD